MGNDEPLEPCIISSAELDFMIRGLESNCRADGRSNSEFRAFELTTGCIDNCFGSARLSNGESHLFCTIRGEVVPPKPITPKFGNYVLTISSTRGSTCQEFLNKAPMSRILDELTHSLNTLMFSSDVTDLTRLSIVPGLFSWRIHVDVTIICAGGNLKQLISLCCLAALRSSSLPRVSVSLKVPGSSDSNLDTESISSITGQLSDGPKEYGHISSTAVFDLHDTVQFTLSSTCVPGFTVFDDVPLINTLCVIAQHALIDPMLAEEVNSGFTINSSVSSTGSIRSTVMSGTRGWPQRLVTMLEDKARHTAQLAFSEILTEESLLRVRSSLDTVLSAFG